MRRDLLGRLVVPAVLFTVVAAGSIAFVVYSERLVDEAEARRAGKQQQLSGARARKANAGLEKDLILRFGPVYHRLEGVGFIGAEQRLDWVDSLRTANSDGHLYGVEYQIGQQDTFSSADIGASGLPMHQSAMRVRLPLLHEGDLMGFFQRVAASRRGVFMITGCTLTRNGTVVSAAQPNLTAECDLNWLTVEDTSTGVPPS